MKNLGLGNNQQVQTKKELKAIKKEVNSSNNWLHHLIRIKPREAKQRKLKPKEVNSNKTSLKLQIKSNNNKILRNSNHNKTY